MKKPLAVGVGLLLLAAFVLFSTSYTVKFNEVAVRATFGEVDESSVVSDAGLHFRWPIFIDRVTKLDKRVQVVESPLEEILLADGQQVVARGFMLWRVDTDGTGPLDFFRGYESVGNAAGALQSQFRTAFSAGLGEYRFDELLGEGSRLAEAEARIRTSLEAQVSGRGIEPVMVGVSQFLLPPRTARATVERMGAERDRLRQEENDKGRAEREALMATANSNATRINAFAEKRAAEIRAEAEQYAASLLDEMSENQELATFLAWLDTLRQSLSDRTTLVISSEHAPFHLLDQTEVMSRDSTIPLPASAREDDPGEGAGAAGAED